MSYFLSKCRGLAAVTRTIALGISIVSAGLMPAQAQQQAWPADRFVDSIGINTHLYVYGTKTSYSTYSLVRSALTGLGVRHLRDEMVIPVPNTPEYSTEQQYNANLQDLAVNYGIKSDLILQSPYYPTAAQCLANTKAYLLNSQECVEGTNELDNWSGYSDTWMSIDNSYTTAIHDAYANDPATAGMPIIGFSTVADAPNDVTNYVNVKGYGSYSSSVTYGNCHPYTYPGCPEATMANLIGVCALLWGADPFVVTETGYFTGTASNHVDAIVQGKYTPRALFTAFNDNAYRTYLYELLDEANTPSNEQDCYGLETYNGTNVTPKPAYTAVKSLIGLLSDPGPAFTTGSISWSMSGNTANFQHTLFQKRSGVYYLAMWVAVNSTDSAVSQAVTLTLPTSATSATLYTLNTSGVRSQTNMTIRNHQCSFNITDTVSVMMFH